MKVIGKQIMTMAVVFSVIVLTPSFASFRGDKIHSKKTIKPQARLEVVATAYYKPHKNQAEYLHGSYKEETRINGTGKVFLDGKPAKIGDIAADWKFIPAGTVVWIPNFDLTATVRDVGKDIKGRRIDVYVGEGEKALKIAKDFGRRRIDIFVLKWGA